MRETSFTDERGRRWAVLLPEGLPEIDASLGLPLGPPSLEGLGLPPEIEVRLHNELFNRRIFTERDAKTRRADIFGALQHALRVDIGKIIDHCYTRAQDESPSPSGDGGSRVKKKGKNQ